MVLSVKGNRGDLLTNAVEECFGVLLDLPDSYQQRLREKFPTYSTVYGLDYFSHEVGLVLRPAYFSTDLYALNGPLGIEYQALKLKQMGWEEAATELMKITGLESTVDAGKKRTVYELIQSTSAEGIQMGKALDRYESQVSRTFQGRALEQISEDLDHCLNASILPKRRRLWGLSDDRILVRRGMSHYKEVSKAVVSLCLDQREVRKTALTFQGRLESLYGSALIARNINPRYPNQRLARFFQCAGPLSMIFSLGIYGSRLFNGEDPFKVTQDFAYGMMTSSLSISTCLLLEGVRSMTA